MNYSITVCALVSAFQCFVHFPTLLPSGSTRAAVSAEKCGLSIWEWDCLICFLDRDHLVSWDSLQTEFMKLKLGEMGNVMTIILICCFSGFTLSFSVIGSVTILTSSYWLLQLYVSCFLEPVFTQQQGINFEVKLLICLLFYNESHEFSPYVSPQSLHSWQRPMRLHSWQEDLWKGFSYCLPASRHILVIMLPFINTFFHF